MAHCPWVGQSLHGKAGLVDAEEDKCFQKADKAALKAGQCLIHEDCSPLTWNGKASWKGPPSLRKTYFSSRRVSLREHLLGVQDHTGRWTCSRTLSLKAHMALNPQDSRGHPELTHASP